MAAKSSLVILYALVIHTEPTVAWLFSIWFLGVSAAPIDSQWGSGSDTVTPEW
jgi:hypothetical protein